MTINADIYICTIGTTIKIAKTKERFKAIDHDLVASFAQMSIRSKARSFHVVSSKGASAKSFFFYNKVKGEMEDYLKSLSMPSLYIYRPSLLVGNREEKRTGEKLAISMYHLTSPILPKGVSKNLGTKVEELSKKMADNIIGHQAGTHLIESIDI